MKLRHLTGTRVLCISSGQILLVRHRNAATGEEYWLLPGGGREPMETFEQAGIREVYEETGSRVRILRRPRVSGHVPDVTCALFLAEPTEHREARQDEP